MNEYSGIVPLDDDETGRLLSERPPGWEYMLLAGSLVQGQRKLDPKYRDYCLGYAPRLGITISPSEFEHFIDSQLGEMQLMAGQLDVVIGPNFMEETVGPLGVTGDPDTIVHNASRLVRLYEDMLMWAQRIRGVAMPSEYRRVADGLVRMLDQPIRELHDFILRFAAQIDKLPAALASGERIVIDETIRLAIPDGVVPEFSSAYAELKKRLRSG